MINKKPVKEKISGYLSYYSHESAKKCVDTEEIWLEITGLNPKILSSKASKSNSGGDPKESEQPKPENISRSLGTTPIPKMRILDPTTLNQIALSILCKNESFLSETNTEPKSANSKQACPVKHYPTDFTKAVTPGVTDQTNEPHAYPESLEETHDLQNATAPTSDPTEAVEQKAPHDPESSKTFKTKSSSIDINSFPARIKLSITYAHTKFTKKMLQNLPAPIRNYIKQIKYKILKYDPASFAFIEEKILCEYLQMEQDGKGLSSLCIKSTQKNREEILRIKSEEDYFTMNKINCNLRNKCDLVCRENVGLYADYYYNLLSTHAPEYIADWKSEGGGSYKHDLKTFLTRSFQPSLETLSTASTARGPGPVPKGQVQSPLNPNARSTGEVYQAPPQNFNGYNQQQQQANVHHRMGHGQQQKPMQQPQMGYGQQQKPMGQYVHAEYFQGSDYAHPQPQHQQQQGQYFQQQCQQQSYGYSGQSYGSNFSGDQSQQNSVPEGNYYYAAPQQQMPQQNNYYYDPNTNQYYYTDSELVNSSLSTNQANLGYSWGSSMSINRNMQQGGQKEGECYYQYESDYFNSYEDPRLRTKGQGQSMDLAYMRDAYSEYKYYSSEDLNYTPDGKQMAMNLCANKQKKKKTSPQNFNKIPAPKNPKGAGTRGGECVKPPAHALL